MMTHFQLQNVEIDEAFRLFQSHFLLPGEAQKIEKIVDEFAKVYISCNRDLPQFNLPLSTGKNAIDLRTFNASVDAKSGALDLNKLENVISLAHITVFSVVILNTDLHNPSNAKHRMKYDEFQKNLGICLSKEQESMTRKEDDAVDSEQPASKPAKKQELQICTRKLRSIYNRVKMKEFENISDHVTQVAKLWKQISAAPKELEHIFNISNSRRLVCYCRLNEIVKNGEKSESNPAPNASKKKHYSFSSGSATEKLNSARTAREVFLFNDLLLVTKETTSRRSRARAKNSNPVSGDHTAAYEYCSHFDLQGKVVKILQVGCRRL